jgi:hypothetical protein
MICDPTQAREILGTDDLWPATDHVISAAATDMRFDREVPNEIAVQLLFVGRDGQKAPRFLTNGHLDQQTLRGVRELSATAAQELDRWLPPDTAIG